MKGTHKRQIGELYERKTKCPRSGKVTVYLVEHLGTHKYRTIERITPYEEAHKSKGIGSRQGSGSGERGKRQEAAKKGTKTGNNLNANLFPLKGSGKIYIAEADRPKKVEVKIKRGMSVFVYPEDVEKTKEKWNLKQAS